MTNKTEPYRPNSAFAVTLGFWVLALAAVAAQGWLAGAEALLRAAPVGATSAFAAWVLFYRPSVSMDDLGVYVVNPFHHHIVPWAGLIEVSTQYTCTLVTPHRRVEIFAAPAPGRQAVAAATVHDLRGYQGQPVRIGDLPTAASGHVARMIRQRWQAKIDAGEIPLGEADTTTVKSTFNWRIAVILAVSIGISALALMVP